MNDVLPKIVKQKMDLENEIYSFHSLLKINDPTMNAIRKNIDVLNQKNTSISNQLTVIKESLENFANSHDTDSSKLNQIKKTLADCKILEQTLQKAYTNTLEKLKLMSVKNIKTGSSIIEMDEEMQEKYLQLSKQEELLDEANQKLDKGIAIGSSILTNLDYQDQRKKSIFSNLNILGKDLNISKWTSSKINQRLMRDKRYLIAVFVGSLILILLVKYLIKRIKMH